MHKNLIRYEGQVAFTPRGAPAIFHSKVLQNKILQLARWHNNTGQSQSNIFEIQFKLYWKTKT